MRPRLLSPESSPQEHYPIPRPDPDINLPISPPCLLRSCTMMPTKPIVLTHLQ